MRSTNDFTDESSRRPRISRSIAIAITLTILFSLKKVYLGSKNLQHNNEINLLVPLISNYDSISSKTISPPIFNTSIISSHVKNLLNTTADENRTEMPIRHISQSTHLPHWVHNYFDFHSKTRSRSDFPHASDIKFLIIVCPKNRIACGGFSDRMRTFDYYIFQANRTKRILLYYWAKPRPLEDFLVPPEGGLNWRVPSGLEFSYGTSKCKEENTPNCANDRILVEKSVQRETASIMNGIWADDIGETVRPKQLASSNYTLIAGQQPIHRSKETIATSRILRELFDMMFQPAPPLEMKIRKTMASLGLVPGRYGAVHIRTSYPTTLAKMNSFQGKSQKDFDKLDSLAVVGKTREMVLNIAHHAVQCVSDLTSRYLEHEKSATVFSPSGLPIYVASDSTDAINLLLSEGKNANMVALTLMPFVQKDDNIHLDGPKYYDRPAEDFYSTFIDFWILKDAACVSYGVGGYGIFGAVLSGNQCVAVHQSHGGRASDSC